MEPHRRMRKIEAYETHSRHKSNFVTLATYLPKDALVSDLVNVESFMSSASTQLAHDIATGHDEKSKPEKYIYISIQ